MFKFTTEQDPMYGEDESIDSEQEYKDIMVLEYCGAVKIYVKYCLDEETFRETKDGIMKILNRQDDTCRWEDGDGNEPSLSLKNNVFTFSTGHSCGYPQGLIRLEMNYEENKTEIHKFLNYMLKKYLTD